MKEFIETVFFAGASIVAWFKVGALAIGALIVFLFTRGAMNLMAGTAKAAA